MSDEEHQPRLLILHEAGGEIKGRGKYHKLLDRYRREADESDIEHVVKERGPYDSGLSRSVRRYRDAGLIETDEEGSSRDIQETEKGKRYMSGFERAKSLVDDSFRETLDTARSVISEYGDSSMNEMVQEEDVQEDKQLPYGSRLSAESEDSDQD